MKMIIRNLCLVFVICMVFSCQSDDEFIPSVPSLSDDEKFELQLEVFNFGDAEFFLIASTEDEIILDTVLNGIPNSLLLNYPKTETLDITYGRSNMSFSDLRTFTAVQSGFKVKGSLVVRCDDPFETTNFELVSENYQLHVDNLPPYTELYSPFAVESQVTFDGAQQQLHLQGKGENNRDFIITIVRGNNEVKSYHIKFEEWEKVDNVLTLQLDYNDFVASTKLILPIGFDQSDFRLYINILLADDRIVRVANWRTPNEQHFDASINYFLPPNLAIEKYKLDIEFFEDDLNSFAFYDNNLNNLLINIPEYTPSIQLDNIKEKSYSISHSENVDLVNVHYQFANQNFNYATWDIYHLSSSPAIFNLDIISTSLEFHFPDLSSGLQEVEKVTTTLYDYVPDIDAAYQESVFDYQLNCFPYSKRVIELEF